MPVQRMMTSVWYTACSQAAGAADQHGSASAQSDWHQCASSHQHSTRQAEIAAPPHLDNLVHHALSSKRPPLSLRGLCILKQLQSMLLQV
jgi:hypothetical protein